MAKSSISGGNPVEAIHTRTSGGSEDSQVAVLGIDGLDTVIAAHPTRGLRVDNAGAQIATGFQSIAVAGSTAVALNAGSFPCKSVFVCAYQSNTSQIAIGDAFVNAQADANLRGIPLQPGQGISLDIADVSSVYLDVLGNGHGCTFTVIY